LRPVLLGDEVYTPSPRRSEGRRANLGSLSGPRREQNLSANPKQTAKTLRSYNETSLISIRSKNLSKSFQNNIRCSPHAKMPFLLGNRVKIHN
jgi:hypothetical protein